MKKYVLGILIIVSALLRLPFLDRFPPALYSDEVSQGYNAYSILKTGHDEYGTFLPVSIRSFGDWKPPLQTYLMIPTIAMVGLNEWGVRLTGAVLGTLSVWLLFLTAKEIDEYFFTKRNEKVALAAAFFLCISPWHILFSRSAMLVGITFFFLLLGLWSFLKGIKQSGYWILTSISFALAIYGYYGARVFVPLFVLLLLFTFWNEIKKRFVNVVVPSLLFFLLLFPLITAYLKNPNVIFGRAKTVSIFYDEGVRQSTYELQRVDSTENQTSLIPFFHPLSVSYAKNIVERFAQHLDGRFLFLQGDTHPPFQIPGMGLMYGVDGLLLVFGLYYLLRKKNKLIFIILSLIVISIVPASLTFVTPSANRTLQLLLPFSLLFGYAVSFLIHSRAHIYLFLFVYAICSAYFLWNFVTVLPTMHASWWHYGFEELYTYLENHKDKKETIYVSENVSVPYIFLLFYQKIDPKQVQKSITRDRHLDEYGFEHVSSYKTYNFIKDFTWKIEKDHLLTNSLLVVPGNELIAELKLERTILYPNGKTAFIIYSL